MHSIDEKVIERLHRYPSDEVGQVAFDRDQHELERARQNIARLGIEESPEELIAQSAQTKPEAKTPIKSEPTVPHVNDGVLDIDVIRLQVEQAQRAA
ncbi:hypothetical protein KDA00_02050 [Candidatus Saccharibacteria bacterium]|nr:hypothetical protein [Candidatus Saccharibacteria bacterium]